MPSALERIDLPLSLGGMGFLLFCLLGVASPTDLIAEPALTPFNVGRRIELADFTAAEASRLAWGLGRPPDVAAALLENLYRMLAQIAARLTSEVAALAA